jgi:hypothetical protein
MWRFKGGLDDLEREDQLRAYADVGGHPRALGYLDALLRGEKARFPDVAERMEKALRDKGISNPRRWMKGVKGDLDRALAEATTLAVDDVLLDRLLERLEGQPLARALLLGASVYRVPVDEIGLAWYQKSLDIDEELGSRAGMAITISQLGVLATARGSPEEAIPLNLRSLTIRLQIGSPEVRIDLYWLGRQRESVGEERFLEVLGQHLSEEDLRTVLELMAQFENARAGATSEGPAE